MDLPHFASSIHGEIEIRAPHYTLYILFCQNHIRCAEFIVNFFEITVGSKIKQYIIPKED